jgi:ankyrin repeat protein
MIEVLLRLGFDPNKTDDIGQTCLFYAARFSQISILGVLKQTNADFNQVDQQGQTPIFYAACYSDKVETLQTLVNYGARPNHVDNLAGQTAIYYAAKHNWLSNVKYLIEVADFDIAHKDKFGDTPIDFA